jgi:uncharacterized protein (DUF983 family)
MENGVCCYREAMTALKAIFRQRCPRCREGRIYRGSLFRSGLAMHERCPVCGLTYKREEGYFVGAMYVSYMLAIPPYLLMVSALWLWAGWPYERALLGAFLAYLPFVPLAMRVSRVVWIHVDQAFDPER